MPPPRARASQGIVSARASNALTLGFGVAGVGSLRLMGGLQVG
jgi:hypothetical protein